MELEERAKIDSWTDERLGFEKNRNILRLAMKSMYDFQRIRMSLDGRLHLKKDGTPMKGDAPTLPEEEREVFTKFRSVASEMESELEEYLEKTLLPRFGIWNDWLKDGVKGVGPLLASVLISTFDIYKATTVSKLWQFSGGNPGMVRGWKAAKEKDGKTTKRDKDGHVLWEITETLVRGDRKTLGFRCPYNSWLKAKLYGVLADSFIKCQKAYSEFYYARKHRLESTDWGQPRGKGTKEGHRHRAARRYMIKMFLKDLYVQWRTEQHLYVREPWIEEFGGKKHNDPKWEQEVDRSEMASDGTVDHVVDVDEEVVE